MYSPKGGVEVESEAHTMKTVSFVEFDDRLIRTVIRDNEIREIARVLFSICKKYDATLVEINPLANTVNGYIPIDCKITLDENARYRWKKFKDIRNDIRTDTELRAKKKGIQYVDLELYGNIGVIGNGAGLVMATLDTLATH